MSDIEHEIVDVTITAPDVDWLRERCAMLLEQRLIASANIIRAVEPMYRWQGEVHRKAEAYGILHTQAACVERNIELTDQTHPYELVHVLSKKIDQASRGHVRWVRQSTNQP